MAEAGPLERLRQGTAPRRLRIAIAEGLVPLDGNDLIEALTILSSDPDLEVLEALETNLPTLPKTFLLQIAHDPSTEPRFIDFMAHLFQDDEEILSALLLNRNIADDTLYFLAQSSLPNILNIISDNRNRMLRYPLILKKLLENERLPRVTRFSLLEFKERFLPDLDEMADEDAIKTSMSETEPVITDVEDTDITADLDEDLPMAEENVAITDEVLQERSEFDIDKLEEMMTMETEEHNGPEGVSEEGDDDGWNIDAFVKEVASETEDVELEDEYGFEDDIDMFNLEEESEKTGVTEQGDGWGDLDIDLEEEEEEEEQEEEEEEDEKIEDTQLRLMKMNASEKLLLAKMGTKQERAILIRDPNKKVATAVINSPKLTEFEVKMFAANRSVCKEVLQEIYLHREWGKRPAIIKELVLNPKTPLAISLKLLNRLNDFDLKEVIKSKEIPYGLSANAKRLFDIRESRRRRRTGA